MGIRVRRFSNGSRTRPRRITTPIQTDGSIGRMTRGASGLRAAALRSSTDNLFQMGPKTGRPATDMSRAPGIPAISPAARGILRETMLVIGTRARLWMRVEAILLLQKVGWLEIMVLPPPQQLSSL